MEEEENELTMTLNNLKNNLTNNLNSDSVEKIDDSITTFLCDNGFGYSENGKGKGLYFFTIDYKNNKDSNDFRKNWRNRLKKHRKYEKPKKKGDGQTVRVEYSALPPVNEQSKTEHILYVGEKNNGNVFSRVEQHKKLISEIKTTSALKLKELDKDFIIKSKMFVLKEETISSELASVYIKAFEKILHEVLQPIVGSSR